MKFEGGQGYIGQFSGWFIFIELFSIEPRNLELDIILKPGAASSFSNASFGKDSVCWIKQNIMEIHAVIESYLGQSSTAM